MRLTLPASLSLLKNSGEENRTLWSRSIIKALTAKNKLGFIHGTVPKPSEEHPDSGSWMRCNALVCTWLTNSVCSVVVRAISHTQLKGLGSSHMDSVVKQTESGTDNVPRCKELNTNESMFLSLGKERRACLDRPDSTVGFCTSPKLTSAT
ncbi:PREDICTED: uncharacterized protein LOC104812223 [Tarenaya hassleriana]|uniref:uncharacterized protein LOC104812223 n=1 Tax=Tarenaya hassleriana TaxID=28532 RepID=UPI00053C4AC3|nr:PREDICTED: uncharacterized protein LOC104812223 [Tarenaya hassleriana]